MPVTELAKLRLQHGQHRISHTLLGKLLQAKKVMEKSSGYAFNYYPSTDELGVFFIIGAWPSVDFHMREFIPGPSNQELLENLKNDIVVEWMFHVDIDPGRMPPPEEIELVAINRHCVGSSVKQGVDATLVAIRDQSGFHTADGGYIEGGWRVNVDQDVGHFTYDSGEFVLFMGGKSVANQSVQAITNRSAERSGAREDGDVEVFHVELLDLGCDG